MTSIDVADAGWPPGRRSHRPRRPVGLAMAIAFLILLAVAVVIPDALARSGDTIDPMNALRSPGADHLFGTDQLGRDVFDRVVQGARSSLALGVGATALAAVSGVAWGLLAGMGSRWVDETAMRVADVFLSVPSMLMALLVVAVLGPGARSVTIAIAIALAPGFARIVRVHTLVVRQAAYVQAATVLGLSRASVIWRHVVPNVISPMIVLATMSVGQAIIAGASLSFLGLGPSASSAEWGAMLAGSRDFLQDAWAPAVFPGLALTLSVISMSVVGRALQARLEGRVGR